MDLEYGREAFSMSSEVKTNKYEMDMCNGPLFSKIMVFSLPLMLSGLLQLLFNAADIVVGSLRGVARVLVISNQISVWLQAERLLDL